jgi:hypothetical protein
MSHQLLAVLVVLGVLGVVVALDLVIPLIAINYAVRLLPCHMPVTHWVKAGAMSCLAETRRKPSDAVTVIIVILTGLVLIVVTGKDRGRFLQGMKMNMKM